jgi:predicted aminopeptidase
MQDSGNMFLKAIRFQIFFCILVAFALTGCESFGYYAQALSGQMTIIKKRRPIQRILTDPKTSENLKDKLGLIFEIREFAENVLYLPVEKHYLTFVELERSYVLWAVYAAPEFSLAPKEWCYPVIGCTAYRGYFSKEDADDCAGRLQNEGYDVYVAGVSAYSTLGWFDDPVLSTFIHQNDIELAAIIFHELAHQRLYIEDDTTFNESFATAVEQEGLRRWLKKKNNPGAFSAYQIDCRRHRRFIQLVMKCRGRLERIYANDLSTQDKRVAKAQEFDRMREDYRQLKQEWKGYSGYDEWFGRPLNNAQLNTVYTYYDLVPAFLKLLDAGGGDLELFYNRCEKLAEKPKEERLAGLQP